MAVAILAVGLTNACGGGSGGSGTGGSATGGNATGGSATGGTGTGGATGGHEGATGGIGGHPTGSGAAGQGGGGAGGVAGNGGQGGAPACFPDGHACSSASECCSFICAVTCNQMIVSDRNRKQDVAAVDDAEILRAVAALPISSWSYRGDASGARHIGPMAQDFASSFHVGADDRMISPVDENGVSLAAIKALNQRVMELERQNRLLEQQISELRRRHGGGRSGKDVP
jgi:hypothetical protein